MARYSRSNPLALMVLCTLWEQPTHPYDVVATLKARHKERAAKLNYGSLYTVVASLEKAGLIEAVDVTREGNLPPRTTYRPTTAGIAEANGWLSDLVARPLDEFPAYMAALSLLPALPRDRAVALLEERLAALNAGVADMERSVAASKAAIPEIFVVEHEYLLAIIVAERDFTAQLVRRLREGSMPGVRVWDAIHASFVDGHPDPQVWGAAFTNEGFANPESASRSSDPKDE